MLELNTNVRTDRQLMLTTNSVFIIRKSVDYSANLFSDRNVNSTNTFLQANKPVLAGVFFPCYRRSHCLPMDMMARLSVHKETDYLVGWLICDQGD